MKCWLLLVTTQSGDKMNVSKSHTKELNVTYFAAVCRTIDTRVPCFAFVVVRNSTTRSDFKQLHAARLLFGTRLGGLRSETIKAQRRARQCPPWRQVT